MLQEEQIALYKNLIVEPREIQIRIDALASEIIQKFSGKHPLFVCLLRGGVPFASRLMFAIAKQDPHFHPELDYMTVSRYGTSREASTPQVVMDLSNKTVLENRPVVVLDDMIDKGGTYLFTKEHLKNRGAEDVYLAVLIERSLREPRNVNADFYCFSVDSELWLTGMGLDDSCLGAEANRWADYIATSELSE